MTVRRGIPVLLAVLVTTPALWAALHRARMEERAQLWECATAHLRVGYAGVSAWRQTEWGPEVRVRHDATTGLTEYRWNERPVILPSPSSRAADPAAFCLDPARAARNYRIRSVGEGFLLGRRTTLLDLEPLHEGRPTVHLTVDVATGLPLATTTMRWDGALYRATSFREVEIAPQSVEEPSRPGSLARYGAACPSDRFAEELGFQPLRPAYLPAGFQESASRLLHSFGGMARTTYDDGITSFEITQRRILTPAQNEQALVARMGERRAEYILRWIRSERVRAVVEAGDTVPGGAVVRRSKIPAHDSYELQVGDLNVTLVARADLHPDEILRVLQSLR
ncbi:MAG: sigma-E factor regulatory protein RseB domain-containing protein [Planctomycetaceae bacterium]